MTPTRIVCAVDGSSHSERALTFALEEAEARGVPLTVVIARPTLSARWSGDARLAEPVTLSQARDLQKNAQGLLDEAERQRGKPAGVPTAVEVLNGPPAEVIEDYLRPTDLLVIGSRGIGGVRRLLLGSVSSALVQTARCPVLVVRPEPPDSDTP
jgi:nucleotide-binding universal stress UspA family protein